MTIEAAADLTETQTSSVGQVVGHRYIDTLPLPNRSANSLVSLSPGVVMIDPGQGAENYPVFSVAGGRERNQSFTLDGGSIGNAVGLTRPQQVASLPLDALEEFRIISNNYAAEYGHSTGGIVALSTRSGTNQYHGSLFEYLRNDALDARNFFAATTPPLHLNQFGAALGGPIRKGQDALLRQLGRDAPERGYRGATRRCRRWRSATATSPASRTQIYDPVHARRTASSSPSPATIIPASRIDPVAMAASAYWPAAEPHGRAERRQQLPRQQLVQPRPRHRRGQTRPQLHRERPRLGPLLHQQRDHGLKRLLWHPGLGSRRRPTPTSASRASSALISTPSARRLLNNFQVSFMQRKFIQTRPGAGENLAGEIGLTGVSDAAFPTFNLAGYALLGSQAVANSSIARIQSPIRDTQILDSVSKFVGKHAIQGRNRVPLRLQQRVE